jgi:hypothetical protein
MGYSAYTKYTISWYSEDVNLSSFWELALIPNLKFQIISHVSLAL